MLILALKANSVVSLYCTFFQILPHCAEWTSDAYCYPSRILHSIDLPWIVFIRCTYFQVQNSSRVCTKVCTEKKIDSHCMVVVQKHLFFDIGKGPHRTCSIMISFCIFRSDTLCSIIREIWSFKKWFTLSDLM